MTETLNIHIEGVLSEHTAPDSLQDEVVNIVEANDCVGITWRNKDGSYLLMLLEEVEPGKVSKQTFTKTSQEYEQTKNIF